MGELEIADGDKCVQFKAFFLTILINGELCNEAYEESFERVIHMETIFTIEKRKLWY